MLCESEDMITIPWDIMEEILRRLPTKSVGRFRCVSKAWLSLLASPRFIKTHQTTPNQNHLIFVSNDLSLYSLPLDHHHKKQVSRSPTKLGLELPNLNLFAFHGSCNGLVLVSADGLVVSNPTTKELVELPVSGYEMVDDLIDTDIRYGFGYDSVSDDYKVVTISYLHFKYLISPDYMYVHVYSLRTNSWKRVTDSPYNHSYGKSFPGVFVNGFLHWFANKGSNRLRLIVAFSLVDEKFHQVPSPDFAIPYNNDCILVDLGGKLGIFLVAKGEIWLMNEYGVSESWTKILVHGFNDMPIVEPTILYDNGKILLVMHDQVWMYHVQERVFCTTVNIQKLKDLKVTGTYVESLISPKFSWIG